MKRKNLMTVLFCTFALTMSSAAALCAAANETEAVTEAATEAAADQTEEGGEAQTDEAQDAVEETEAVLERPDYNALDYVTLGEYKGLTVEDQPAEVTEEQIDSEVEYYIQLADALESVTEGTVEEGDTANIDYEGKLNGEAFDGGTAKGYDLMIGSNSFIDGFEDGLIGVAVGETVDLPLTFPENYGNEDLAGQDVVFTVTVNEIKRMPEVTDELISTVTDGEYTDVASYREYIRGYLTESAESQREYQLKLELLTQVANTAEIKEYPQEMIDYGMANMDSYYRSMAEAYSMELGEFLEAYMGMTEEEFEEQARDAVQQNLQQELYLKAIAEAEGLEVTDEELAESGAEYAAQYGYETVEELMAAYGESTVRVSIMQDKVLDFLLENAVITEPEAATEAVTEAPAAE